MLAAKSLEEAQEEALGEYGVHDMITMNSLTEENILKNIQRRFAKNIIYTYIGSILVAMNPYQMLPIYTQKAVDQYVGKPLGALPPHIFALADAAYRALRETGKNQSVIISGDSGAGKTETTKLILQYLASMTQKHSEVEQMILETSPILEAFGNARTVRNNNSSRFGKFIEIHFNDEGRICGARIVQYLLEKSRVIYQAPNERNFHIFYQLTQGVTEEEKVQLHLKDPRQFSFLNQSGCIEIEGVDDGENLDRTRFAMTLLGIDDDMQMRVFAVLSAVLHLGDVRFESAGEGSKVSNVDEVKIISELLGVDSAQLQLLLTNKRLNIRGQITQVPLNPKQAAEARDALAKILYKRLFEWLVSRINAAILKPGRKNFIGVLDIFGFENFKVNSFEQFCIDYANEKLQMQFNHHLFKLEQEEYDKEAINWAKIAFKDNQECIDLIEKTNPPGIVSLLDEECRFPKGTDQSFLEKITKAFGTHNFFSKPKTSRNTFIIKHYAGDVEYTVENFLDKNRDTIGDDLLQLVINSKYVLLREMFKQDAEDSKTQQAGRRTIATQFRANLAELMTTLWSCNAWYVRCIKPNMLQQPVNFDVDLVLAQMRYTGMMDTIRIRRLGYPIRWALLDFFRRYEILVPGTQLSKDLRASVSQLMQRLELNKDEVQLGKTKVFLRDKEHRKLEERRNQRIARVVVVIQAWWKMIAQRMRFRLMRRSAIRIQAFWRGYRQRRRFLYQRERVMVLQSTVRMLIERRRQHAALLEKRRRDEELRRQRALEEERRRKELEKRKKEEEKQRAKEEEKRRKEEEKLYKELEKKAKKEGKPLPPLPGSQSPLSPRATASEDGAAGDDLEVDPSWDMLGSPRAGSGGSGGSGGGAAPAPSQSPLSPRETMSRSGGARPAPQLVTDASGIKTLRGGVEVGMNTMKMGTMTLRRKHGKPLQTIPSAPPIVNRGDEQRYMWAEYAQKHFRVVPCVPPGGKSTIKRGTTLSLQELTTYSTKPLKQSLLPLKLELQKLAIQIFSNEGAPKKESKAHKWAPVNFILQQGLTITDIRDEIYNQIIKQTNNCGNKEHLVRAWELLLYCVCTFLPSENFVPYLAVYINHHMSRSDDEQQVGRVATFAMERLKRAVHNRLNRTRPPSAVELFALQKLQVLKVQIFMPGPQPSSWTYEVDSITQVGEVIGLLAAKLKLPDPVGYALYEVMDPAAKLEQSLGMYDYIADSLGKPEVKRITFKKKLHLHPKEIPESPVEVKLLVHQIMEEIVDGSLPVQEHEVLELAAYHLQIKLQKKKTSSEPVRFDLKRHLPRDQIKRHSAEEWKNLIFAKHKSLPGLDKKTKPECRLLYLQLATTRLEFFGTTLFPVDVEPKSNPLAWPSRVWIGVNAEGVHIMHFETRKKLRSFFFTEVELWAYQYKTKFFYNDGKKQLTIEIYTTRGFELASLVKDYMFWLRLESQYAQAIKDFHPGDDPNLLSFNKGDLIYITEKDEEAGWYVGDCNGRMGQFPADHVEVLIAVPPAIAKLLQSQAQTPTKARESFRRSGQYLQAKEAGRVGGPRNSLFAQATANAARAAGSSSGSSRVSVRLSANLSGKAGSRASWRPDFGKAPKNYDPSRFTFEIFARSYFDGLTGTSEKSKVDAAISFVAAPLKSPLLQSTESSLAKNCALIFECVMKYMEDFPDKHKSKPADILHQILTEAIERPALRDEIYCAIIKQTIGNPKPAHAQKGWELLLVCLRFFLPTELLLPYMISHMSTTAENKMGLPAIATLAEQCLDRLAITQNTGNRLTVPSLKEIDSILTGQKLTCDCYLADDTKKTINIDSATIVGEVVSEMLRQTKLPSNKLWALHEVITARDFDRERPLKPTDSVLDVINSWKSFKPPKGVENVQFKLVYKKMIFLGEPDEHEFSDPRIMPLLFHQSVYAIISCKQPLIEEEAIFFASHYLQVVKGDAPPATDPVIQPMLPDLLPTPFLLTRPATYWLPKLGTAWAALRGRNREDLMRAYIARARQWPLYGCARFAVQYAMTKKSTVDATIAINKDGLHLLEIYSKQPLKSWPYNQISSWIPTKTAFTIVSGNLLNPKREIFRTTEAEDIAVMYRAYVEAMSAVKILQSRNNMMMVDGATE